MSTHTSDSYNCATCGLALASPNAPCPNCLRDTGNPWPDLKNPLIDLVDKPGLGAAMRHAIERATVARASNENLDPNRKWESDLEDRMGAKPTIVANEIVQLAEGLRDTVMHNAGVMDQYQDWTGVFEDFAKIIAALRGSHETGVDWKARAETAEGILGHNMALANATTRRTMTERDGIVRKLREKYSAIEIADMVGLTRQRVHQILNEAHELKAKVHHHPNCLGDSYCTCIPGQS